MRKLRALIVDDEPFARERVRRLLADDADVEIVGECADGFAAVAAVNEHAPDLLFLDVQMPGKDGFAVLDEIAGAHAPLVIFLTAYDSYAVRAFEACALDYLLKPFDEERFEKAIARAKAQLHRAEEGSDSTASLINAQETRAESAPLERVVVKTGGRIFFLKTAEVDWIEAYGNYVRLHVGQS
ncbi:MAG TPA: response regulator, partial [Pyrinomonadaceae bacterium]|nr:response regulator [Pyrinomonadaceae bacterium]